MNSGDDRTPPHSPSHTPSPPHSPSTTTISSSTKRCRVDDDDDDEEEEDRRIPHAHQRLSSLVSYRPYINKEEERRQHDHVTSSTSTTDIPVSKQETYRDRSPLRESSSRNERLKPRLSDRYDSPVKSRSSPERRSSEHRSSERTERSEHRNEHPGLTSPPNVTVLQPSVAHPMFSYLYHNNSYHGATPTVPFPINPLMFPHHQPPSLPTLPFAFPTSSHQQQQAAVAALTAAAAVSSESSPSVQNLAAHGMLLNGLWPHAYSHPASSHHLESLYAQRSSAQRFTPYSLPVTKTTMVTTATPTMSSGDGPASPDGSQQSRSPTHSSPSPKQSDRKPSNSELRSIEKMVNGLEQRQEQIATDSLSKLEK